MKLDFTRGHISNAVALEGMVVSAIYYLFRLQILYTALCQKTFIRLRNSHSNQTLQTSDNKQRSQFRTTVDESGFAVVVVMLLVPEHTKQISAHISLIVKKCTVVVEI